MKEEKYDKNYRPYQSVISPEEQGELRPDIRPEREKWKELDRNGKLRYFLDYYGFKTLGLVLVLAVIISLTVHIATKDNIVFRLVAVNTVAGQGAGKDASYYTNFLEEQGLDTKKDAASVHTSLNIDPFSDDSLESTALESIETLFMSQAVDVFMADEDFYGCMAGTDYVGDLTDYLSEDILEQYQDEIVYADNIVTGEHFPAGIRLVDNAWIKESGLYDATAVIGFADEAKNRELAIAFVQMVLGEESK